MVSGVGLTTRVAVEAPGAKVIWGELRENLVRKAS